jgi:hypothetical protein
VAGAGVQLEEGGWPQEGGAIRPGEGVLGLGVAKLIAAGAGTHQGAAVETQGVEGLDLLHKRSSLAL